MEKTIHLLFSYGTLQSEKVQLENYGRTLKGKPDILTGYRLHKIQITDSSVLAKSQLEYHPIAIKSENKADFIEGLLFEITESELAKTDNYEVSQYHRIRETVDSGKKAWIYVAKIE
ncbi:gamma-glutamylcyclotransferase family protein [Cyclobacterium plantarum]|uniref:Gamma-glutamylcyclotransferase n=1 Tax=Cyclobacterium plantarum TaxID=2716263 RepID=A0ABX0HGG1_9BACT|nr:gamma-glutamylcyclotransferase family protein [Cyclobacterium plantarum]NHE59434.1 gamma-glutamylcyclotransferase [Cyclobacterium plantarum]